LSLRNITKMHSNLGRTQEFLSNLKNWLKIVAIFGYMSEEPTKEDSKLVHEELKDHLTDVLEIFLVLQEKLERVEGLAGVLKNTTKRMFERDVDYNELSDWNFFLEKDKICLINKKTKERIEV